MTLKLFQNTHQIICRMFFRWELSDILPVIILGLWVLGRRTTEVKPQLLTGHLVDVKLDRLAEVVFSRFLPAKDTLYYLLFFPYCTSWISFYSQSHLRSGEVCFRFFRVEINLKSHKWFELCLQGRFVYSLSIYLIIYLPQYGLMDIYFVLWVIIWYYFIFLLKLAVLTIGKSFSWLLYSLT